MSPKECIMSQGIGTCKKYHCAPIQFSTAWIFCLPIWHCFTQNQIMINKLYLIDLKKKFIRLGFTVHINLTNWYEVNRKQLSYFPFSFLYFFFLLLFFASVPNDDHVFTLCILMESTTAICWTSSFVIRGM